MEKNKEEIIMTAAMLLPLISYYIGNFVIGFFPLYFIVFLLSAFVLMVTSWVGLVRALRSESVNKGTTLQSGKMRLPSSICMWALGIFLSLMMFGMFWTFVNRESSVLLRVRIYAIISLLLSVAQVIISWKKNADKWGMIVGLAALVYILLEPLEAILGEP